ncbi:RNA-binding protein [Ruficoccus sp. ZRK36]|uniref:RNA recognition motif domain-containing protein n=1 Tax=Ruficoccus sp. ZRK36 TaxID=2866311 RepID=UPI0021021E15|nr:RNA-binding protein [Ruficoccus sp. ZRK36]
MSQGLDAKRNTMDIYVGNLPYELDEQTLQEAFAAYGEVEKAKIIMDHETGRSKGFAFVTMTDNEAGQNAIAELNGAELNGRPMKVNEARPREERPRRDFGGGGFGGGGGGGFRKPGGFKRGGGGGYGGGGGGGHRGGRDRRGGRGGYQDGFGD